MTRPHLRRFGLVGVTLLASLGAAGCSLDLGSPDSVQATPSVGPLRSPEVVLPTPSPVRPPPSPVQGNPPPD